MGDTRSHPGHLIPKRAEGRAARGQRRPAGRDAGRESRDGRAVRAKAGMHRPRIHFQEES